MWGAVTRCDVRVQCGRICCNLLPTRVVEGSNCRISATLCPRDREDTVGNVAYIIISIPEKFLNTIDRCTWVGATCGRTRANRCHLCCHLSRPSAKRLRLAAAWSLSDKVHVGTNEVGARTVPVCPQKHANGAVVETLVDQVHPHQVGGFCLLWRHKCACNERETSDEKY